MIIHALHLHPMKSILTAIIALILLQACSSNKRGITEEEVKLAIDRFDMGWKYKKPDTCRFRFVCFIHVFYSIRWHIQPRECCPDCRVAGV